MPTVTWPVPPQVRQLTPSTVPSPPQTGQNVSPVPAVPGAASSPGLSGGEGCSGSAPSLPAGWSLAACTRGLWDAGSAGASDAAGSITTVLASKCDWYSLLINVADDLQASNRPSHTFVVFGLNDCVPMAPFHNKRLKTTSAEYLYREKKKKKGSLYQMTQNSYTLIPTLSCTNNM